MDVVAELETGISLRNGVLLHMWSYVCFREHLIMSDSCDVPKE